MVKRILITDEAKAIIDKLREENSELMFHQSGGCCDGSAPMCFPAGELMIDESDVCLGTVYDCKFYMSRDQFEYWDHTQLTINVVKGRGASFSLEIPLGVRFVIESRLFSDQEMQNLEPVHLGL